MIDRILTLNEKEEEMEEEETDDKSDDKLEERSDDNSDSKPDDKSDDKSEDKSDDKPEDKPEEIVPVAYQNNHGMKEVEEIDEYGRIIHRHVSNEIAVNVVTTYNDTTQQSIPNATASKIISIKLNFYLKHSIPREFVINIEIVL